jgi:hypothetical protein
MSDHDDDDSNHGGNTYTYANPAPPQKGIAKGRMALRSRSQRSYKIEPTDAVRVGCNPIWWFVGGVMIIVGITVGVSFNNYLT